MKKLLVLALAFSVMLSVAAFAQYGSQEPAKTDKSADAPLKSVKGTVKSWDVMNPEALKGHEGHHVEVSAHVYADKNAIHVMSVKMLKDKSEDKMAK